jgi:hypothetical protein
LPGLNRKGKQKPAIWAFILSICHPALSKNQVDQKLNYCKRDTEQQGIPEASNIEFGQDPLD